MCDIYKKPWMILYDLLMTKHLIEKYQFQKLVSKNTNILRRMKKNYTADDIIRHLNH